jgi:putative CocE/NonD family hydrolase
VITVEFDVEARMRDGTILRANIYRPDGKGPWPTLLARLPYGKDRNPEVYTWLDPIEAARQGFMVVVQDTRGRFRSDGEWSPLRFEARDGYDSVEWAGRLAGSNGRVGMYGMSYYGNVQWTAALEHPAALKAISPAVTWSDPLDGLFARGGAIELGLGLFWSLLTGVDQLSELQIPAIERASAIERHLDEIDELAADGYWHLPVQEIPALERDYMPDIGTFTMLSEPAVASLSTVAGRQDEVTIPSLHIGGWYDVFAQGVLDNYVASTTAERPAQLVMGPWYHDLTTVSDRVGDLSFGVRSAALGAPISQGGDINDLQLRWFRRHLGTDLDGNVLEEAPVRIFVMGRNEWRDEDAWPLARAKPVCWYFWPQGQLRPESPGPDGGTTGFTYDPVDPVPTVGGPIEMAPSFRRGPLEQAPVEARPDVCLFTSPPLEHDLEVTGRIRAKLHVGSSAPSTDWVARLCDVHPDGRSFGICDGIHRLTDDATSPQDVEIDLWSTSHVFLAGHRLRVQVTSSCFPRWDRNLNTGAQRESRWQTARQQIFHDAERRSSVELPLVPS